jgi:hypothetical protein
VYYCSMCNAAKLAVTLHYITCHFSLIPENEMFYAAVLLMPHYPHIIQHKANIQTQNTPTCFSTSKHSSNEFSKIRQSLSICAIACSTEDYTTFTATHHAPKT